MLDPQARALLDLIASRGLPPTHELTPAEARSFYRERRFFTQPDPPPMAECRDLAAPGPNGAIPLRLYRAEAGAAPVLGENFVQSNEEDGDEAAAAGAAVPRAEEGDDVIDDVIGEES